MSDDSSHELDRAIHFGSEFLRTPLAREWPVELRPFAPAPVPLNRVIGVGPHVGHEPKQQADGGRESIFPIRLTKRRVVQQQLVPLERPLLVRSQALLQAVVRRVPDAPRRTAPRLWKLLHVRTSQLRVKPETSREVRCPVIRRSGWRGDLTDSLSDHPHQFRIRVHPGDPTKSPVAGGAAVRHQSRHQPDLHTDPVRDAEPPVGLGRYSGLVGVWGMSGILHSMLRRQNLNPIPRCDRKRP